jgi:hypothetical protein
MKSAEIISKMVVDLSPNKWFVVFSCGHSKVMTDEQLHRPVMDNLYSPDSAKPAWILL